MREINSVDVLIIGAGAAGMMCAIEAGKRGRRTLVLDHSDKIGKKILISGGGRCNFTNMKVTSEAFFSKNSHFCKSALSRFTSADFIRLIESHQIAYYEKKLGQLFCTTSARQIVDLLTTECERVGVEFQLSTKVLSIDVVRSPQPFGLRDDKVHFHIITEQGVLEAASVVIATGGLSLPKVGATDFGYRMAKQFGLDIVETAPALDGFIFPKTLQESLQGLAGVSVDARVTCDGISFRENILFTHQGLSGPAALQASLYWRPKSPIVIDLLPDHDMAEWFLEKKKEGSRAEVKSLLATFLTKSFSERLTELYLPHKNSPLSQIPDQELKDFSFRLKSWTIIPERTVGYQKAEVTRGGVSTEELSSKTMESKKVPGLYFIGEVVDVTGWLGGYNFQWAWSSGWAAGQCV